MEFTIIFTFTQILDYFRFMPFVALFDLSSHFFTGLFLADLLFKRFSLKKKVIVGFITGFLPDFDYFGQILGIMAHRTLTHSPWFALISLAGIRIKNIIFIAACILLHHAVDLIDIWSYKAAYLSMITSIYFTIKYIEKRNRFYPI